MAGLWEGVPASPCSSASDDMPMRSMDARKRDPDLPTLSPAIKRARSAPPPPPAHFVDAAASRSDSSADLVARLNFSAADERRKLLLQRLRAIDAKKAALKLSDADGGEAIIKEPGSASAVTSEYRVASPSKPVPAAQVVKGRKNTAAARRVSLRRSARGVAPASADVAVASDVSMTVTKPVLPSLDLMGLDKSTARSVPLSRFSDLHTPVASSPVPSSTPSPSLSPPTESEGVPSGNSKPQKRASRRVTRPRTPSVLLSGMPGEAPSLSQLPVGVSKCKRLLFCKKLVNSIIRNASARPFSAPVNELWPPHSIPRYFDVITRPMDLRTVKRQLETNHYFREVVIAGHATHVLDQAVFSEDVCLVFRNAMVYNSAGDMLYNCARKLMEDFQLAMKDIPALPSAEEQTAALVAKKRVGASRSKRARSSISDERGSTSVGSSRRATASVGTTSDAHVGPSHAATSGRSKQRNSKRPSTSGAVRGKGIASRPQVVANSGSALKTAKQIRSRLADLDKCRVALLSRTPLPKGAGYLSRAALLHDEQMSYEQKQRMRAAVHTVPASKVPQMVAMISKATGETADGRDDDFEFDMDALSNKTLRDLEAFLEQFAVGFETIRTSDIGQQFSHMDDVKDEIRALEARLARMNKATERQVDEGPKPSFCEGAPGLYPSSSDESSGEEESDDSDSDGSSDSDSS